MSGKMKEAKTIYDPKTKIWSGIKVDLPFGQTSNLGEEAVRSLMKDPDHISQICYDNGREYTNREIADLSQRVAQHLTKLNMEQCDVIGLCAANSDYVAPLFFGTALCGLTMSTLDPSFDKDGIKHIFSLTKPKLMFCDGSIYSTVKAAFDEINLKATIYTIIDHIDGVPNIMEFLKETGSESSFKPEPLKLGCNQTAIILCSSGTTGLPKGVCISHASLLNNTFFNLHRDDRLLSFSTLYWASGLLCLTAGTLEGATRVISRKGYSPEDFFAIIEKYKITFMFTPPSQIAMAVASPKINDYDLSSVVCFVCGGSAVPYSLIEKLKPFMPNTDFIVGYGMSEVCGAISFGSALPDGSTGQVARNGKLKIIDDAGVQLGPGESGEICLKSPLPWAGYFENLEATEAIYDKDGWILSGDIGYIDDKGDVFVVDRKKDILKYNNFHFFPTEIENAILEIAGVAEVCVCGIPDIVSSFLPAAAIVKLPNSSLTEDEVCQYVAKRMAHFKHLHGGVFFLDNIPKTASGKNLRRVVTDICLKLRNLKKS